MVKQSSNFHGFRMIFGIAIVCLCACQLAIAQPLQRIDGGLFYFPPTGSLLTIGGWGPEDWNPLHTVWSLKSAAWSAMPDIPEAVTHTAAAYDEANQRLIVMGGVMPDLSTWAFDGKAWSKVAAPIPANPGFDPEIVYDAEAKQLVLYYATFNADAANGTYILGANGWEKLTLGSEPGAALDVGFVYDQVRKEGVWFDGSKTWTWKNTTWMNKQPAQSPSFEAGFFGAAFDAARQVVVVYGQGQTWTWDGANWTQRTPAQSPDNPKRGFFGFGYDANRQTVVLWGGELVISEQPYITRYLDDLWEWNGTTWYKSGSTSVRFWNLH